MSNPNKFEPLLLSGPELNDVLGSVYSFIFEKGRPQSPRGQEVLEWPGPVILEFFKHSHPWTFVPERRLNPYFAIAEVIWILAGREDVGFISYFNKQIQNYSDDGKRFHAAYGARLRNTPLYLEHFDNGGFVKDTIDQIELVVGRLIQDPSSRQAVLSLWDPARDLQGNFKDYPCNNLCYFTLRDGTLSMSVTRRSNDMIWGLPYNQIQFYFIQAMVAGSLGVEMGPCVEYIQNLHVYTQLYPELLKKFISLSYNGFDLVNPQKVQEVDRRISLEEFRNFESVFWNCFKMSVVKDIEALPEIWEKSRKLLHEKEIPVYWIENMAALPIAYVARKRGDLVTHNEILKNIEPALRWMVLDFNSK